MVFCVGGDEIKGDLSVHHRSRSIWGESAMVTGAVPSGNFGSVGEPTSFCCWCVATPLVFFTYLLLLRACPLLLLLLESWMTMSSEGSSCSSSSANPSLPFSLSIFPWLPSSLLSSLISLEISFVGVGVGDWSELAVQMKANAVRQHSRHLLPI